MQLQSMVISQILEPSVTLPVIRLTSKSGFIGRDEGVGNALLIPRTPCSTNPVHVSVHLLGSVIIDHTLDALDVQAAGCHVSGHQHMVLAHLVLMQYCHAAMLVHVTMNGCSPAGATDWCQLLCLICLPGDHDLLHHATCCSGPAAAAVAA